MKTGKAKRLPVFKSDEEAEAFLEQDISDYISAETIAPFRYVFQPQPSQADHTKSAAPKKRRRASR